jgi:hypothetical protein
LKQATRLVRTERPDRVALHPRAVDECGGVPCDQTPPDGLVECCPECAAEVTNGLRFETFPKLLVEKCLNLLRCEAFKGDAAKRRFQMAADVDLVSGVGPGADTRLGDFCQPLVEKITDRSTAGICISPVL